MTERILGQLREQKTMRENLADQQLLLLKQKHAEMKLLEAKLCALEEQERAQKEMAIDPRKVQVFDTAKAAEKTRAEQSDDLSTPFENQEQMIQYLQDDNVKAKLMELRRQSEEMKVLEAQLAELRALKDAVMGNKQSGSQQAQEPLKRPQEILNAASFIENVLREGAKNAQPGDEDSQALESLLQRLVNASVQDEETLLPETNNQANSKCEEIIISNIDEQGELVQEKEARAEEIQEETVRDLEKNQEVIEEEEEEEGDNSFQIEELASTKQKIVSAIEV
jgi:hypothetical protein